MFAVSLKVSLSRHDSCSYQHSSLRRVIDESEHGRRYIAQDPQATAYQFQRRKERPTACVFDLDMSSQIKSVDQGQLNLMGLLEMRIKSLYTALQDMQSEIETFNKVSEIPIEGGLDFYEEVARFEIYLIERALAQANGVQKEAARLLKLRTSTLSQKIKLYHISSKYYPYRVQ